ncbi:MAG: helix-turn-helix domain-containing protein [Bacteroidetes bacterium]|nr:MAG: helix-turn-helix domain-containing protein [Bacteroidota bacterium]
MRGYTQDDMAEKLAMSQSDYSKIELDETDVPFSRLLQISKVLEVSLSDLINFDEGKLLMNNTWHEPSQGFVFHQGLAETERKLYESRIEAQQKEKERLHALLEKALSK